MIYKFTTKQCGIGFDFDIELEKDKQIYCFIGKNGIGKTQLLENMAKSLIFTHSMFGNIDGYAYKNLFAQKNIIGKLKDLSLQLPLDIDINDIKIKDENIHKWGFTSFDFIASNRMNNFIFDKPIVFIGAKDRGFVKNIDPNNIKILDGTQGRFVESIKRTMSYINGDGLAHGEIANWFVARLIVNPNFVLAGQDKTNEVITVLKLIDKLEPALNLVSENPNGGYFLNIAYSEGKLLLNNTPLDKLSTGFVSIVKIFQEIIAGYGGWANIDDLSQVDGVVFIDEIEPHLHISWQTKIIRILKEFFPKTTFYISTHSPLVLAGLKNGEAYELIRVDDFAKAKEVKNIDNYFLNDIVKEFFGVDLNKEKIDNPDKEKHKKAKELLLNLAQNLAKDEL